MKDDTELNPTLGFIRQKRVLAEPGADVDIRSTFASSIQCAATLHLSALQGLYLPFEGYPQRY